MTNEKFTPVEWCISTEDDDCFIVRDKKGGFVCYGGCFDPNNKSEVEAAKKDICLIAVAPEMYKELGKLEDVLRSFVRECVPGSGKANLLWSCIDEILELREKARGER